MRKVCLVSIPTTNCPFLKMSQARRPHMERGYPRTFESSAPAVRLPPVRRPPYPSTSYHHSEDEYLDSGYAGPVPVDDFEVASVSHSDQPSMQPPKDRSETVDMDDFKSSLEEVFSGHQRTELQEDFKKVLQMNLLTDEWLDTLYLKSPALAYNQKYLLTALVSFYRLAYPDLFRKYNDSLSAWLEFVLTVCIFRSPAALTDYCSLLDRNTATTKVPNSASDEFKKIDRKRPAENVTIAPLAKTLKSDDVVNPFLKTAVYLRWPQIFKIGSFASKLVPSVFAILDVVIEWTTVPKRLKGRTESTFFKGGRIKFRKPFVGAMKAEADKKDNMRKYVCYVDNFTTAFSEMTESIVASNAFEIGNLNNNKMKCLNLVTGIERVPSQGDPLNDGFYTALVKEFVATKTAGGFVGCKTYINQFYFADTEFNKMTPTESENCKVLNEGKKDELEETYSEYERIVAEKQAELEAKRVAYENNLAK